MISANIGFINVDYEKCITGLAEHLKAEDASWLKAETGRLLAKAVPYAGHVFDKLPDPKKAKLAEWLLNHNRIRIASAINGALHSDPYAKNILVGIIEFHVARKGILLHGERIVVDYEALVKDPGIKKILENEAGNKLQDINMLRKLGMDTVLKSQTGLLAGIAVKLIPGNVEEMIIELLNAKDNKVKIRELVNKGIADAGLVMETGRIRFFRG